MNTKQMAELADTVRMSLDGLLAPNLTDQVRFSFFLQTSLDNPELLFSELGLLATTGANQVVCSPSCRRYVVRVDTQTMEQEQGVLASVVLPDTRESALAVKAWAIRAAKRIGVNELRLVVQEVQTIDAPAANNDDPFQLGFEW